MIEEGGIFELGPYLIEFLYLAKVHLYPLVVVLAGGGVPVGVACLPHGAVVVVKGIFGLEPFVVVGGGRGLPTPQGGDCHAQPIPPTGGQGGRVWGLMCRNYFVYVSFLVECHFVYADLAVEAVY